MKRTPATTHRSLERGLAVLEIVAHAKGALTLSDAARRAGLHRSTAHHLIRSLVSLGYLRQEDRTRGYALTQKLYQLTDRRFGIDELRHAAQPLLEELTRLTDEGTSAAAWIDSQVVIVAKNEASSPVRVVQDLGGIRPIYCTAVGKAIAAWLPEAQLKAALATTRLERRTPNTIVSRAAFEAALRRIRSVGYAIDDEEHYVGLRCVAMPVFGYGGAVVGSMCVLGPRHRMTRRKLRDVRAPLAAQTRLLSAQLGYVDG